MTALVFVANSPCIVIQSDRSHAPRPDAVMIPIWKYRKGYDLSLITSWYMLSSCIGFSTLAHFVHFNMLTICGQLWKTWLFSFHLRIWRYCIQDTLSRISSLLYGRTGGIDFTTPWLCACVVVMRSRGRDHSFWASHLSTVHGIALWWVFHHSVLPGNPSGFHWLWMLCLMPWAGPLSECCASSLFTNHDEWCPFNWYTHFGFELFSMQSICWWLYSLPIQYALCTFSLARFVNLFHVFPLSLFGMIPNKNG